jgi:hypothetical protein
VPGIGAAPKAEGRGAEDRGQHLRHPGRIIGLAKTVIGRLNMIDIMENQVLGPAILKGEATVLTRLLEKRFGTLPEWVPEKLGRAKEPELMEWTDRVLTASTLNDVFKA